MIMIENVKKKKNTTKDYRTIYIIRRHTQKLDIFIYMQKQVERKTSIKKLPNDYTGQ